MHEKERQKEDCLETALREYGNELEMSKELKETLAYTYGQLEKNSAIQQRTSASKRWLKCAGIVMAFLVGVGTIGVCNPALAEKIPVLYKVFEGLNHTLFQGTTEGKYAEPKQLSVIANGLEVTLEEIYCDQRELGYTYTIRSLDEKIKTSTKEYVAVFSDVSMVIDGEPISLPTMHGGGAYVDDYTYTGKRIYEVEETLPEQFELQLMIHNFATIHEPAVFRFDGQWAFDVLVTKHTNPDSEVVTADMRWEVTMPRPFALTVHEIGFTPIHTYLSIRDSQAESIQPILSDYDLKFTMIDSLGQTYFLENGGGRSKENETFEWLINYSIPNEIPRWIAVVPSVVPYTEGGWLPTERSVEVAYAGKLPITIQREGVGDITVVEVEEIDGQLVIGLEVAPLQPSTWIHAKWKDGTWLNPSSSEFDGKNQLTLTYDGGLADFIGISVEDSGEKFDIEQMIQIPISRVK